MKNAIALSMAKFGIKAVVLIEREELNQVILSMKNSPDSDWCGGLGREYFHSSLLKKLKSECAYFDAHPVEISLSNQRWTDFCDDCVVLVAVDSALYNNPVMALHPDLYKEKVAGLKNPSGLPSEVPFIEGINVLN